MRKGRTAGVPVMRRKSPWITSRNPGFWSWRNRSIAPIVKLLALLICSTLAAVNAGLIGVQIRLPAGATARATLLLIEVPIWTDSGTAQPVGVLAATVNT